ncbi:trichohyalin-like [Etheostoma spectabile]|uniref:trichohyalin-like n=1 Tax=Etheostoma spectabile TaxID=54343 RepID=UPI0013AED9FC|nr:trichohyalin-like [Etheostoma spectabile]
MATNAQLESLRRTLLEVRNQKEELVSVNAGLVEEKGKILKALESERSMRKNLKKEIIQSEAKWKIKVSALENQVRRERAAKKEISEIEEELERMSRETEAEWDRKEAQMKEEIKILQQQNTELSLSLTELQKKKRETEDECLVEEKGKILKALQSERSMRKDLKKDQKLKDEEIRLLKERLTQDNNLKESVTRHCSSEVNGFNGSIKEEDESRRQAWQDEVNGLKLKIKDLTMKTEDLTKRNEDLTMKNKDLSMKNEYLMMKNKDLIELDRREKSTIVIMQQEVVELKIAQEVFDKELSRVVVEKNDLINKILTLETETLECLAKLEKKESEIIQSEAKWQRKLSALEDQVRHERAAKEEISEREEELDRKRREMEDKWDSKVVQKEEEMKILQQQNTELRVLQLSLQELAQKTDKEKAKLRRKEKKAEEEELKRQRKEKEEMEKRDKKKRKEEAEREKKVKMENEKRRKEEMKQLKKEEKEKEKRDKKERREELNSPPITLNR